ncbi:MAG: uridine diphosphate-N-acetylglucosamine-binding protein YvcK, partial [Planctomycetes bacterium]|nr:uridine diphosphate-N-acetylglucosamine-binding protein YvcK [Planctomycetota bacterium]
PPGDIRNCLAALSDAGPILERLFQYRFDQGDLKGHPFGNIFLAAMTRTTGDFGAAVKEANRVLSVRGRVLPATTSKLSLVAEHEDGSKTTGESLVGKMNKPVVKLEIRPEDVPAGPEVVEAIMSADLVLMGPGSVYTSVLPNLLIPDIRKALAETNAVRGYVCNIMTQPGETQGFSASQHVKTILSQTDGVPIDFVIVNDGEIPAQLAQSYEAQESTPVECDLKELEQLPGSPKIAMADLVAADHVVRHNSAKLAELCLATLKEVKKG